MLNPHSSRKKRQEKPSIAVIIPCYKVRSTLLDVLKAIGSEVENIYCVDDACPHDSLEAIVNYRKQDSRIHAIERLVNGGVGAATISGYKAALADGATILVKIDGDGQMNPQLVPDLIAPILDGEADYVKGNRFFDIETVKAMPTVRIIGNAGLSFFSKLSTGYWDLFDSTNGMTAIDAKVLSAIPLDRLHPRFFFESDLLFRLGLLRARIIELPMFAVYDDRQTSNLNELKALLTFPYLHFKNFIKRIIYNYFLRNFSLASLNLVSGLLLFLIGFTFGLWQWWLVIVTQVPATSGTVMLAALPIIVGLQLLLNFLAYDMSSTPTVPIRDRIQFSRPRQLSSRSGAR